MSRQRTQAKNGKLLIYGAGGHALVVAETAVAAGWQVLAFLADDAAPGQTLEGLQVLLPTANEAQADASVIVAIGENSVRQRVQNERTAKNRVLACVVHPTAWVSPSAEIGLGVYIGPQAVVNGQARLGPGVIINSAAVVEHHNEIGAFAHIGPRAVLAGNVHVGERTLVGVGACVRPGIRIGAKCVVGAGATVVKDVRDGVTVKGTPAR